MSEHSIRMLCVYEYFIDGCLDGGSVEYASKIEQKVLCAKDADLVLWYTNQPNSVIRQTYSTYKFTWSRELYLFCDIVILYERANDSLLSLCMFIVQCTLICAFTKTLKSYWQSFHFNDDFHVGFCNKVGQNIISIGWGRWYVICVCGKRKLFHTEIKCRSKILLSVSISISAYMDMFIWIQDSILWVHFFI